MDFHEKKPLLLKNKPESNRYRGDVSSESTSDDENWSDGSSSSYYSDSDSSVPEWDPSVQDDGELIYIVCDLKKGSSKIETASKTDANLGIVERGSFTRQSVRRSSRGKLLKLLRRRNSNRVKSKSNKDSKSGAGIENQTAKNQNLNVEASSASVGKVTFIESQDGEVKELVMEVDFTNRLRYGRRISQIESLFGISINTFDDGKRVMVSGILPEGRAINQRQIKIGDWLKKIDNQEVTADNIEQILSNYPQEIVPVKLVLQRVAAVEVSPDDLGQTSNTYSNLACQLTDSTNEHEVVLTQVLRDLSVAVLYLTTEGLSENGPENDGVLYCYPRPEKYNFLCTARGTFITLNHLIPEISKHWKPYSSTVFVKDSYVNIAYTSRGSELLLLALPEKKCNLFELKYINKELVRMLEFCYQSLNRCFKGGGNVKKLDHLFSRLLAQILTCGYGWDSQNGVRLENIRLLSEISSQPLFEQCLPMVQEVNLPWEAQLQIDDALTELEAADYREWNDDPFDCQRLFVVIGTCLYYSGHLLVSHLQDSDLQDVHSFLRMQGFLAISCQESLQSLIVWKEVFISSCNRGLPQDPHTGRQPSGVDIYMLPMGRWFLVIIGKGKLLLVTLLEAGTATVKAEGTILPEPFYVEECESCVDLLVDVGLDKFLEQWFSCNARPQVQIEPESLLPKSKGNKDSGFAAAFTKKAPSPISKKSPEIQSILKRRHHSNENISNIARGAEDSLNATSSSTQPQSHINASYWAKSHNSNTHSLSNLDINYSEDSESQKSTSEVSEERVEGRRVAREREQRQNQNSISSDSDAEWDGCEANSQHSGGYDLSELSHSLLEKMDVVLPTKITAGTDNICFHFIRIDCERGVLLAPTVQVQKQSESELYKHILLNFRKASQTIHTLFQNTIRFKKMLSPSSSVNKSLVAIKEHGILFNVPAKYFAQSSSSKKGVTFSYWVIGRLFENQQSSEVYVCCHDSVPQNIVEIAFRLGLNY